MELYIKEACTKHRRYRYLQAEMSGTRPPVHLVNGFIGKSHT